MGAEEGPSLSPRCASPAAAVPRRDAEKQIASRILISHLPLSGGIFPGCNYFYLQADKNYSALELGRVLCVLKQLLSSPVKTQKNGEVSFPLCSDLSFPLAGTPGCFIWNIQMFFFFHGTGKRG